MLDHATQTNTTSKLDAAVSTPLKRTFHSVTSTSDEEDVPLVQLADPIHVELVDIKPSAAPSPVETRKISPLPRRRFRFPRSTLAGVVVGLAVGMTATFAGLAALDDI